MKEDIMMENKIGFTIGKFAPLHKGHEFLINTAIKEMDEFYVVVYDTNLIDIDMKKRGEWIQKLYPKVHILYAYDSPKQYGLDKDSVEIQMKYLSNIIKDIPVTHFYSSEPYGEKVAEYLNIKNVVVDLNRENVPIHGGVIRSNYEKNKDFIEDFVLKDCIKKAN